MVDYYKKLIQRIKCPRLFECPLNGEMSSCNRCQKNIKEEAASAIGELLNSLKAADADNKRWKQICEAQNERIDELEKRTERAEDTIAEIKRARDFIRPELNSKVVIGGEENAVD